MIALDIDRFCRIAQSTREPTAMWRARFPLSLSLCLRPDAKLSLLAGHSGVATARCLVEPDIACWRWATQSQSAWGSSRSLPTRIEPNWQAGQAVRWKDRAGTFRRDVGDGEHSEILIGERVYRVRTRELGLVRQVARRCS